MSGTTAITIVLIAFSNTAAFGPPGHQGVMENAWRILYANDPARCAIQWPSGWDEWRLEACEYPDASVKYPTLDEAVAPFIVIADALASQGAPAELSAALRALADVLGLPDALNSADHYFDPTNPAAVAGPWTIEWLVDQLKLRFPDQAAIIESCRAPIKLGYEGYFTITPGLARDFDTCYGGGTGIWPTNGADGEGYNAMTAILFFLNGRRANDQGNPCMQAPSMGFVQLARQARHDDPEDRNFRDSLICLGVSIHYVADLFSPGHTAWESWTTDILAAVGYPHPHSEFDQQGDLYFVDLTSIQGIQPKVILEYRGGKEHCAVTSCRNLGTSTHPYPEGFASMDLPAALIEVANVSHSQWLRRNENPPPSDEHYLHMVGRSVEVAAGVIDWAFSSAATAPDQVYTRDATDFFGMAKGQATLKESPAYVTPGEFKGRTCSLGGIDRDDYYPVRGNSNRYARISILKGPPACAGRLIKAQAWPLEADTPIEGEVVLGDGQPAIEIPLGTESSSPPGSFLLRVYAPGGDAVKYTLLFTDDPLPPTPNPKPAPKPSGGTAWLVMLAIMMIGFSFLLRPILGRLSNGLVLIALGMVGVAWMCDTWSLSRGSLWGLLIGVLVIVLLIRGGMKQLFGSHSR